jgi:uncharacterized membrane protein (UPF0127 family)
MFKTIKKLNIIFGLSLLLIAIALFIYAQNNNLENNPNIISEVCFENKCFNVEIVDTSKEREIGLMNREDLAMNNGMLFVFKKEGIYNFWMKNTLIFLDIIWIDENNKIIFIKENAKPCKTNDDKCELFTPNKKAKYVLEINGGIIEEIGIEVDNEVEFK